MVKISSSVRLVTVQFSFTNRNFVPISIPRRNAETPVEHVGRKNQIQGKLMIPATKNTTSVATTPQQLKEEGFVLVDAFSVERIGKKPGQRDMYYVVRFVFARADQLERPDEYAKLATTSLHQLRQLDFEEMCAAAMWQVRAYLNPLFKDGELVEENATISINLDGRNPLFLPNGKSVTARQKDPMTGKPVGEPLPIQPENQLTIVDSVLQLIPVSEPVAA